MSPVDYHGWTHRPKAQGGTDPIEVETTPGGSSDPVEWALLQSTTNWGAVDATVLDFGLTNGGYDAVTPTFAVNGSDNFEINKAGVYTIDGFVINPGVDGSGTVRTQIRLDIARLAGPTPSGIHGWSTGVDFFTFRTYFDPPAPFVESATAQHFHDLVSWDEGDFVGTPAEFRVQAVNFQDGTPAVDNTVTVRILVVRVGNIFA